MKVSVPSSTYGRNVSCCALLKRCTSSRNSTVRRPRSARTVARCSTASRMSFTPAMHRGERMNSASARRAISRASVVLPVPGGPQRISECSCPRSSAWRSGLPGRAPAPARRTRRACADACGRRAAAAHRRARRRAGSPARPRARRAGSFSAALRPSDRHELRPAREPDQRGRRPTLAPIDSRRTSRASAVPPTCMQCLRDLDADAEQSRSSEDLPPAAPLARGPRTRRPARRARRNGSSLSLNGTCPAACRRGNRHTDHDDNATSTKPTDPPEPLRSVHGTGVPMTSAPAGGVNVTSASRHGRIALARPGSRAATVWPSLSLSTMRLSSAVAEAELRLAKIRVGPLRHDRHPVEAVALAAGVDREQRRECSRRPTAGSRVSRSARVRADFTVTCSRSRS